MTIATLAICGISRLLRLLLQRRDSLERVRDVHGANGWIFWLIGVITAFLTSFYMFRLWFMTFFGEYRGAQGTISMPATKSTHGHRHMKARR